MLGLGLLGLHELGPLCLALGRGGRGLGPWAGGSGIGALLGTLVGRLVLYLRREHQESVGLDDFLALGLISLSYGVALLAHSYGFLAVFAAGWRCGGWS
jgi:NhaP-type Na+/H+ or K+/H+ antiporter